MGLISSFLENPREMLIFLLLALPGRIMALSAHEFAHAWVANRCGDPTARLMGRMTLNPLKHIDIVGLLMMLFAGIGWAKPVPVNPINFRHYRSDDLKVSVAGVTMNLILFLLGGLAMYAFVGAALSQVPKLESMQSVLAPPDRFISTYDGVRCMMLKEGSQYFYFPLQDLLSNAAYASDVLVAPVFGQVAGYVYQMLGYFVVVNIMLAVFNLLPIPPLDGYHVLNDLVLKKPLFASQQAGIAGFVILYALLATNILDSALSAVQSFIFGNIGSLMGMVYSALNII